MLKSPIMPEGRPSGWPGWLRHRRSQYPDRDLIRQTAATSHHAIVCHET